VSEKSTRHKSLTVTFFVIFRKKLELSEWEKKIPGFVVEKISRKDL